MNSEAKTEEETPTDMKEEVTLEHVTQDNF